MADHETPIPADIRDEANRLAEAAISLGLSARLIGGLAIWLRCPSVRSGPFARSYEDMDFAITSASSTRFKALLMTQGYIPDQFFNGLHGATRLFYSEPTGRWSIDVVIDELAMSHTLDLRGRLDGPAPTITLADLLLTKLQVWEINRKDLGDTLCLLADHALSNDDVRHRGDQPRAGALGPRQGLGFLPHRPPQYAEGRGVVVAGAAARGRARCRSPGRRFAAGDRGRTEVPCLAAPQPSR